MKQILLFLIFFGFVAVLDVQAQGCVKNAAARAAALDESIVQKVSATTGDVTYARKKVCPATGDVSYTDMEYCSKSGQFVAVSKPYKSSCSKMTAASCSKYYSQNAMAAGDNGGECTAAQKAACLQAKQKAQTAKAAFVSLDNKVIKP
jgi:hypothetical protein